MVLSSVSPSTARGLQPEMGQDGYSWGWKPAEQVSKVCMNESRVLCRVDDIPDFGAVSVHIDSSTGGFDLVLIRRGSEIFAYHNECPHQGRKLDYVPGKFLIKEGRIICAAHGAMFSVQSGECVSGPCSNGLLRVPIRVEAGEVFSA
jgi:nitrite reductase/ring-hydroxylating ferredoxin subunit